MNTRLPNPTRPSPLMPAVPAPRLDPQTVIAFQEQENASLRQLVLLLTKGYKDSVGREKVIHALVEHELLYGNLDGRP